MVRCVRHGVYLAALFATQTWADSVRDSSGYPVSPSWVSGGKAMMTYANGANFGIVGLRGLSVTQPVVVLSVSGVMSASNANFNWLSNVQSIRLNVFSSETAFGAHPLSGDVYTTASVAIENLIGNAPPAWGGVNIAGWTNRWVDLAFTPFVLQPGTYVVSVLFAVNSGFLSWTETVHDYGLAGDVGAISGGGGAYIEYALASGYTTGDAAVRIEVTPVAPACPADMGSTGGTPGPDGVLDNNDFIVFIDAFFASNPAADFGATGGVPGPDGHFDNNDFVVFIDRFFAGCS